MSTIIRPSDVFESEELREECCQLGSAYSEGYNKGYADGSLSVTEQIINEKVVKYLEGKKARLPKVGNERLIALLDELIKHFKEATK